MESCALECKLALGAQAVSEALVNTLVHADYSDRAAVRVVKSAAGFEFRNQGALRVPPDQALHGGISDCRNRTLQQMFLMLNLDERAGSGLSRIREGWLAEGRTLDLRDSFEPFDHTVLTLGWPAAEAMGKTPGKTTEAILRQLRQDPSLTIAQLSAALEKSESAIGRALRKLRDQEPLRRSGPGKGGQWEVLS